MELPKIGMGTFGSDKYDEKTVSEAVKSALKLGYRMFDCASVYGNEADIGRVFSEAFQSKTVRREDLIVMSKVWNDCHGDGEVIESCLRTLKDLRLTYLDVYFMHWPFPNYHAKGCSGDARNPDSRPFFKEEFLAAWREMEWLKRNGFVREIAMSNMTIPKFEAVYPDLEILPFAHEMELHPSFQQQELFAYCKEKGMKVIGYCPLGSPNRPERDRTPEDISDTEMPEIKEIAEKKGCHPAEICLAWAMKRGQIPIPFATKERNLIKNLAAADTVTLTDEEFSVLSGLDRGNRLVKGQVFLWNGAQDWRDLWDENGTLETWTPDGGQWVKK